MKYDLTIAEQRAGIRRERLLRRLKEDRQRLNFLAELMKLPTASIHFNDDAAIEEVGGAPVGYTIRLDASCKPAVQITAATFRGVIDKAKKELARANNVKSRKPRRKA